jgi:choline dehydrogenase-like flavoprotein
MLLEGGSDKQTDHSQARYKVRLSVDDDMTYPDIHENRLRYLGGTTNHWAGWSRPLKSNVFAPRSGIEGRWPFDADELAPQYLKAHELCGLGRFEYDAAQLLSDNGFETVVEETNDLALLSFRNSPIVGVP